jgi:N-methylhydantoinase A
LIWPGLKVAVDVGGTFVDLLAIDESGALRWRKVPNAAGDLSSAVGAAIREMLGRMAATNTPAVLLHSTTLATNALVEGRLPAVGLIVTRGFREILGVNGRRAGASEPGAGLAVTGASIVPLELVCEVGERIAADGSVITDLDEETVRAAARWFYARDISVIVVSLLHSYANPSHERRVSEIVRREIDGVEVILSSAVNRRASEYERTASTCANAALMSVMAGYLGGLAPAASDFPAESPLLVMQGSGGLTSARGALRRPLDTVMSGPSAAVVAMAWLAEQAGYENLITVDMGGTSTDIGCIAQHEPQCRVERSVGGCPSLSQMIEVTSIAAGGGSVAWWGPEGKLCVGPRSASAAPGPACYGQHGTEATVTDAHLALGRLPARLLGGEIVLDENAAQHALERLARRQGREPRRVTAGIIEITTHAICGAIRRMLARIGRDAGDHALLVMGGAGPLHAAYLADLLKIERVLIPLRPGFAAAFGLLAADFEIGFAQSVMQRADNPDLALIATTLRELHERAWSELEREGILPERRRIVPSADFHYLGMSAELSVPLSEPLTRPAFDVTVRRFHDRFRAAFGYSREGNAEVELTNLRVAGVGMVTKAQPPRIAAGRQASPTGRRDVHFVETGQTCACPIYDRDELGAGAKLNGPAILEQYDSTVVIPPRWRATVDPFGTLIMER